MKGFFLYSGEGNRTPDQSDMSRVLYHLSYAATCMISGDNIAIMIHVVNINSLVYNPDQNKNVL
jgi:hypothetical protein